MLLIGTRPMRQSQSAKLRTVRIATKSLQWWGCHLTSSDLGTVLVSCGSHYRPVCYDSSVLRGPVDVRTLAELPNGWAGSTRPAPIISLFPTLSELQTLKLQFITKEENKKELAPARPASKRLLRYLTFGLSFESDKLNLFFCKSQ